MVIFDMAPTGNQAQGWGLQGRWLSSEPETLNPMTL